MTNEEWLNKYIRILSSLGDRFDNSGVTMSYGPHTVLKIIAVYYYAEMFAKIATGPSAKAKGYDGAVYLDLFAGSGLVSVEGSGDLIAGSPIAATSTSYPFDYSVFVEIDQARATALRARLSTYLDSSRFEVVNGDSNLLISSIIESVRSKFRRPIVLAFVDPQGMEARWTSAEALTHAFPSIDFMINMTSGAARVAGRIAGGMTSDIPIFQDFFGTRAEDVLLKLSQGISVETQYREAVRNVLGRPRGATIDICAVGDRVVYHLLGYTRESWTGAPWAGGFDSLKGRLEPFDGEAVARVLNVVKGRQGSLSNWYRQD